MIRTVHLFLAAFIFLSCQVSSQTIGSLKAQIEQIIQKKNAIVGVSIVGSNGIDTLSVNGGMHFPMQSVFKFHIALVVLSEVDKGKLQLMQKIEVSKSDLLPDTWSPIREKYPDGAVLTLAQILEYTVSQSDNSGCDLLLRLIGGSQMVDEYFKSKDFSDISVQVNEEEMQKEWDTQFLNWTTPNSATNVLKAFYDNKQNLLSPLCYDFIWKTMKETSTGINRIKGKLPKYAVVAHKTGSSGVNRNGITAAVNDIGIVFLPNGQYFYISVLVTNSLENSDSNEEIIADITRAAWDYFTSGNK
jgi:beta-lactamase class A/beta-lactamase class A VEB